MGLDIGSRLDAMSTKSVWYYSTVVEVFIEKQNKKVRVSYRVFHDTGDRTDSDGNKYFGLGPNEDEILDVMSPRIQKEGTMRRKLCYFSFESSDYVMDDSYDLLFRK